MRTGRMEVKDIMQSVKRQKQGVDTGARVSMCRKELVEPRIQGADTGACVSKGWSVDLQ
jgi:hypothetical protein